MSYAYKWVDSPIGRLQLVGSDAGLAAILWEKEREGRVRLGPLSRDEDHPVLDDTAAQLVEYFDRRRSEFDVPLAFVGTTFQKKVWSALLGIPYGETRSYADVAREIGHPTAYRAVGAANGRNPISIIAPCHRVLGSSGGLTGFAGGLEAKHFLLTLEANSERVAS